MYFCLSSSSIPDCKELGVGIFMGVSALFFQDRTCHSVLSSQSHWSLAVAMVDGMYLSQDRYGIDASELGLLFCAAGAAMVAFQVGLKRPRAGVGNTVPAHAARALWWASLSRWWAGTAFWDKCFQVVQKI